MSKETNHNKPPKKSTALIDYRCGAFCTKGDDSVKCGYCKFKKNKKCGTIGFDTKTRSSSGGTFIKVPDDRCLVMPRKKPEGKNGV